MDDPLKSDRSKDTSDKTKTKIGSGTYTKCAVKPIVILMGMHKNVGQTSQPGTKYLSKILFHIHWWCSILLLLVTGSMFLLYFLNLDITNFLNRFRLKKMFNCVYCPNSKST